MITGWRRAEFAEPPAPCGPPYRFRDPARNSPRRLAELEASDQRRRERDASGPSYHAPGGIFLDAARSSAQAARERALERHAEFARLREAGASTEAAGEAVGIAARTARRYELRRIREGGAP